MSSNPKDQFPEIPDRRVYIYASLPVLEEMAKGWSRPVEAHVDRMPDGSWNMTLRACYNEQGEQIARPNEGWFHKQ